MIIKCPNCNRDTPDEYKCQYCKYVIKLKPNNYEKEIYEYLKTDYLNSRNKAITIKNGMQKYNKSMKETKEIVDYIADEIYDIENYKSKEDLDAQTSAETKHDNSNVLKRIGLSFLLLSMAVISSIGLVTAEKKYDNNTISAILASITIVSFIMFAFSLKPKKVRKANTYYFSFVQYFIHDLVYKILLLAALCCVPSCFKEIFFNENNMMLLLIWFLAIFILFFRFLFKWAESSTASITVDLSKVCFQFRKTNPSLKSEQLDRLHHLAWSNYVDYNIHSITKVTETINSIIIYGNITKKQFYVTPIRDYRHYKPKEYKKIVIRKCFKNNKELIRKLRNKIRKPQI